MKVNSVKNPANMTAVKRRMAMAPIGLAQSNLQTIARLSHRICCKLMILGGLLLFVSGSEGRPMYHPLQRGECCR